MKLRSFCRPLALIVVAAMCIAAVAPTALSQEDADRVMQANRRLAERFSQSRMSDMVFDTRVQPHWLEGSDRFWYSWESSRGKSFYLVDPVRGTRAEIFDNADIAAKISLATRDPYDAQHLPIDSIEFSDDGTTVRFDVTSSQDEEVEEVEEAEQEEEIDGDTQEEKGTQKKAKPKKKIFHFEYDLQTRELRELEDWEEPTDHPDWASISPDKQWVVFARDHDLYMLDAENYQEWLDKEKAKKDAGEEDADDEDGEEEESDVDPDIEEIRLTTDGEEHYGYAGGGRGDTDKERAKNKGKRQRASISWAKDSAKFAMIRSDQRKVEDLWVIHAMKEPRPELETYRYDMPGEENATQSELWIFDIAAQGGEQIDVSAFKDQSLSIWEARQFPRPDAREPVPDLWLSEDSSTLYFGRLSRDHRRMDVGRIDTASGEVTVLIEERLNTYLEPIQEMRLDRIAATGELIWWSERDGWGHYYLFGPDGTLRNRITSGPYHAVNVAGIDESRRELLFNAAGREEGEDPYYVHLYRVKLDGSGLTLLNAGDFDHATSMSESRGYFIDNFSRVNTVPKSELRDRNGQLVVELEEADLSLLMAAGYQWPEPFMVKAGDGVTDLYGVMYKPFDFDEARKYPLIEYVYPGPQTEAVTKSFSGRAQNVHLANMGFIVIEIGNRGGHPFRSKWYHNYGYGDLRDYGLEDKKVAAEQLAARHDFIDLDRVGIFGHSGGGFMSTAAMLVYPDFFKVAVSSSGNHDNKIYNRWWSEIHHGVDEVEKDDGEIAFEYMIDRNPDLAKNLKGHLMLTTGDVDNNVHPALTYRMAEALMKANKRFDFFLFPGERHGYRTFADYWSWLRAEYFAEHLLGDRNDQVDIDELNRDVPQNGKSR
jgi:dipeptidyl aminopeptidase/acylaminoacyl peptidase